MEHGCLRAAFSELTHFTALVEVDALNTHRKDARKVFPVSLTAQAPFAGPFLEWTGQLLQ